MVSKQHNMAEPVVPSSLLLGDPAMDLLKVPPTRVLAIASHVAYGYVGNTMATFVMQTLGCEVSAINTVHFSNHTAYKQVKGRKVPADEVAELWAGLSASHLDDFDMMLTGYVPTAEAVEVVGNIARELKAKAQPKPGSFFWMLDPVMGDNGSLYVAADVPPAYKKILGDADLILPNQFEVEVLSETKITDMLSLVDAIARLHRTYRVPHIIVTSLRLSNDQVASSADHLTIVGSTARSDMTPRLFKISVPAIPVFFSGTGDMFSALTVARFRSAAHSAGLSTTKQWLSPDSVTASELPLAQSCRYVLASMQAILNKTMDARNKEIEEYQATAGASSLTAEEQAHEDHLRLTKAAEIRVVQHAGTLQNPPDAEHFEVIPIEEL